MGSVLFMTLEGEDDIGKTVETAVAASKPRTDLVNADIRSRYFKFWFYFLELQIREIHPILKLLDIKTKINVNESLLISRRDCVYYTQLLFCKSQ